MLLGTKESYTVLVIQENSVKNVLPQFKCVLSILNAIHVSSC